MLFISPKFEVVIIVFVVVVVVVVGVFLLFCFVFQFNSIIMYLFWSNFILAFKLYFPMFRTTFDSQQAAFFTVVVFIKYSRTCLKRPPKMITSLITMKSQWSLTRVEPEGGGGGGDGLFVLWELV